MMEEFGDGEALPVGDLSQCNTCKRMFLPKVLEKHAKICQKSASKRRKVFDSSRQRAAGTDIPTLKPLKPKSQSSSAQKAEPPKKPSNWRKKHEDFLAVLKASKASAKAMKEGGPLPPPPAPTFDPDLVKCPYCQRRFNENSAQGHIKFCQDQASRMSNRNKSEPKKAPARTQYKPPPLVKKVNSASSSIPSASSRLPARSGLSQPTGVPSSKTSPAASMRPSPSPSPSSGVGIKNRVVSSGYGSVRNTTPVRGPLNRKKLEDTCITRDDVDGSVGNGDVKSKFCHSCGTRYPIEAAKFCCECGIRRLCI
ncbi:zinc finger C2HC domain-containing protein 1A isoform X2 [Syngnathus typhle]|uniref:zinc finger C2HC domain-containing protein 1A isoform X2 n=1 Tax=Syngnathus typhle TaxID=161592 RepID=UPI002A6B04E1|nr:zinc finger C2HC domain-containing protein 1A isoform X2 [Syngnathus typhle]